MGKVYVQSWTSYGKKYDYLRHVIENLNRKIITLFNRTVIDNKFQAISIGTIRRFECVIDFTPVTVY